MSAQNQYTELTGRPDRLVNFEIVLNRTRPFCMAWSLGTLRGATDFVAEWAAGQITGFDPRRWQRVQEDLAEVHSSLDDLHRVLINAAWRADRGLSHRTEAAMATSHGPHIIERGYRRLLQIMGSESSSEKHLLEKWYRDAVLFDLLEGTSQILKLTVGRGIFAAAGRESGARRRLRWLLSRPDASPRRPARPDVSPAGRAAGRPVRRH